MCKVICGRLGELLKEAASGSECDVVAAFPFIYFIFLVFPLQQDRQWGQPVSGLPPPVGEKVL